MKRALFLLILAWGTAAAANDLLKVGKTPAEKLDEKVKAAKDNVDRALEKIKAKNAATTRMLKRPFSAPAALPDPTAPDESFRQTFRALLRGRSGGGDDRLPPMPNVELGALVLKQDAEPAALVKIDGRTVLVRDNEQITLVKDGIAIHLRIQAIGNDSVRILILPYNEILILQ